jgi:hypothetical protein
MAGGAGSDGGAARVCAYLIAALLAATAMAPAVAVAGEHDARRRKPPKAWDEQILPLVDAVENLRGLHFEHPVPVEFLGNREFENELEADPQLTKQEREDLKRSTGTLRALSLFDGDPDELLEAVATVDAAGTLAFYDSEEERIVVRGGDLDVETEVTVVHELVHTLQDQHFDLDALLDDAESAAAETALTSLVEGDAVRIEQDYVFSLPPAEQDEYFAASANTAGEIEEGLSADVPEIIPVTLSLPYDLGPFFTADLYADGGNDAVDDAFEQPPVTEENILDSATYLDGDDLEKVDQIELEQGEKKVGSTEPFGALSWFLVLAARIDPATAVDAVEGWGGDEFVQFERDGTACVRIAYRGETAEDTERMATALDQWAATLPAGVAGVERGSQLTLTACDLGQDTVHEPNALFDAELLLYNRAVIGSFLKQSPGSLDPTVARCAALLLALDPAYVDWFNRETTEEEDIPFFDQTEGAVAACEG